MAIDLDGLIKELQAAGIAFSVVNEQGVVWDPTYNQIQHRPDVAAVIAAHNPSVWVIVYTRIRDRLATAIAYLKQYPWSLTTQTEWQTYFDANLSSAEVDRVVGTITNIETAKSALALMWKRQNAHMDRLTKVEIALRDIIRPDNPET